MPTGQLQIQYKILTEPPVQPPGTQPSWYQKFSEPTRRIALTAAVIASGITWTPQPISGSNDVPVVSPADAAVPRRQAFSHRYPSTTDVFYGANSVAVIPTADATVPRRQALLYRLQPTTDVFVFSTAETVTLDKWNSRLSEPTRKIAAQQQPFLTWLPQPVSGSGDVAISSTNVVVPYQRTLLYPSLADAIVVTTAAETITTDKWQAPLSQPAARLRTPAGQPFFYFVKSEDVSADRWLQSLSVPTRARPINQPQTIIVKADPFAESVSIDKWGQPLSEPKRFAKNLNAYQQPFAYFVKADPFQETVSADRWQQPLSEPMRRRGYPTQAQDELSFVGSDTARDSRWFAPLSEPTRRKPIAEFPASSWSEFTPASAEVVTVDKYFAWLTEPRRFPRELAAHQQPYFAFVQAAPFAEAVSIDRWQQPLSAPTRRRFAPPEFALSLSYRVAETITIDKWHSPLSCPTLAKPRETFPFAFYGSPISGVGDCIIVTTNAIVPYQRTVLHPTLSYHPGTVEIITVDKWLASLSQPVLRRGLGSFEHPSLSFVKAAPFAENVTADRWFQPLSVPVRRRNAHIFAPISVFADFPTLDRWFSTLSQPTRRKVNVSSYLSPIFIAPTFQIELVTIDKWFSTLSQPTLRKVSFPTLASSSGEAPYVIFFYHDHSRPPRHTLTSRTDRDAIILRRDPSATHRARPSLAKRSEQTFRRGKPSNRKRDN